MAFTVTMLSDCAVLYELLQCWNVHSESTALHLTFHAQHCYMMVADNSSLGTLPCSSQCV